MGRSDPRWRRPPRSAGRGRRGPAPPDRRPAAVRTSGRQTRCGAAAAPRTSSWPGRTSWTPACRVSVPNIVSPVSTTSSRTAGSSRAPIRREQRPHGRGEDDEVRAGQGEVEPLAARQGADQGQGAGGAVVADQREVALGGGVGREGGGQPGVGKEALAGDQRAGVLVQARRRRAQPQAAGVELAPRTAGRPGQGGAHPRALAGGQPRGGGRVAEPPRADQRRHASHLPTSWTNGATSPPAG